MLIPKCLIHSWKFTVKMGHVNVNFDCLGREVPSVATNNLEVPIFRCLLTLVGGYWGSPMFTRYYIPSPNFMRAKVCRFLKAHFGKIETFIRIKLSCVSTCTLEALRHNLWHACQLPSLFKVTGGGGGRGKGKSRWWQLLERR